MAKFWVPIYKKDGHELFVLRSDFRGVDEEDAIKIGLGSMLVECILLDMEYLEAREIDTECIPNVEAKLGASYVAIISGPLFDERS